MTSLRLDRKYHAHDNWGLSRCAVGDTRGSGAILDKPEISVVIPVFQAALSLVELYQEAVSAFRHITDTYEIIFVEDCGTDGSWQIIRELAAQDERVRGFRLRRNFGQHSALLCGIAAARYPIIVTMDDDLQHPAQNIGPLVAKLLEGYDVVYGTPEQKQHGLFRKTASTVTGVALRTMMGVEGAQNISSLRAFRTDLREAFKQYRGAAPSIDALLAWATSRFGAIKVPHRPRRYGRSGYGPRKLIRYAISMTIGFSTLPLKIASIAGFAFTFMGTLVLAWVLIPYFLSGASVPGFTFLASIIAIFSGAQLFALGVIGEYIGRLYSRSFDQPPFVVGETCGTRPPGRSRPPS